MTLNKIIQGEILEPIILRRERDEIGESEFHHLVREVLKLCPQTDTHPLVKTAVNMIERDKRILPHERPPGAPGSVPSNPYKVDAQADMETWYKPIVHYLIDHPDATLQEIAKTIGVNNERKVFIVVEYLVEQAWLSARSTFSSNVVLEEIE